MIVLYNQSYRKVLHEMCFLSIMLYVVMLGYLVKADRPLEIILQGNDTKHCEITYFWIVIKNPDKYRLNQNSHIHTCIQEGRKQTQLTPSGVDINSELYKFDLVTLTDVEYYMAKAKTDKAYVPSTDRFFYIKEGLEKYKIMLIWRQDFAMGSPVSVEIVDQSNSDIMVPPQHILCFRRLCPPPITTTTIPKTTTTTTNVPIVENELYRNAYAEVNDGFLYPVDSAASRSVLSRNVFMFQVIATAIGALAAVLAILLVVVLVMYRRSMSERDKVEKQLDSVIKSSRPKEQQYPTIGNISRRRSLAIAQREASLPRGQKPPSCYSSNNNSIDGTLPRPSMANGKPPQSNGGGGGGVAFSPYNSGSQGGGGCYVPLLSNGQESMMTTQTLMTNHPSNRSLSHSPDV